MIHDGSPILQALVASLFTWGVTALGAAVVFFLPPHSKKLLDVSLGFAAGVMTAASFWSLLAPAIEISEHSLHALAFIPVSIGFASGAAFVHLADRIMPSCVFSDMSVVELLAEDRSTTKIQFIATSDGKEKAGEEKSVLEVDEEDPTVRYGNAPPHSSTALSWRRILLLIIAVTVHNIPEGLAVGVAFGSIGKATKATFESAFNLALGIGLQNFPEGLAVSLPLAAFGHPKLKSFLYGQLSGMVEPVAALLGAAAVILMEPVLPYALSFAAGAMIYVVVDDIIPEAQRNGNGKIASISAIVGFIIMMSLDVGLG
ncbi:unnamed protein product [Enterobius vermicularis]|uniref:Zinc transporter ZIP11 n=1 Tax=Enterobius vermicularis TaxID=51028 RepID=A0A0N4V304_ENTVE|nr:unnamed protein product [Enterobius vermicularis]